IRADENPALGAAQRREDRVVVVRVDVPVDLVVHAGRVTRRDLARDRSDHPERERREAEQKEDEKDQEEPELANPVWAPVPGRALPDPRSEEHTSELQSRGHLVCRLLLENKNQRSLAAEQRGVLCLG